MATCPRCGGFFGEGHRCSSWIYGRAAWRLVRVASAGAIVGWLLIAASFGTPPSWWALALAAAIAVFVDLHALT